MLRLSFILLLLATCGKDETVSAYGAADKVWALTSINEQNFPVRATLTFPEPGRINGEGPCNSYFASQSAPYPWFEVGPIGSTKRACPELAEEARFFKTLSSMTISEVSGDTLILSNDERQKMIFTSE